MESFGYKVLKGEDDNLILCEEIGFNDLGSFCTMISSTGSNKTMCQIGAETAVNSF